MCFRPYLGLKSAQKLCVPYALFHQELIQLTEVVNGQQFDQQKSERYEGCDQFTVQQQFTLVFRLDARFHSRNGIPYDPLEKSNATKVNFSFGIILYAKVSQTGFPLQKAKDCTTGRKVYIKPHSSQLYIFNNNILFLFHLHGNRKKNSS